MIAKTPCDPNYRYFDQRLSFLALIAWVSLCLIITGWLPHLDSGLRRIWASAGLIGLASAVGLAEAIKTELRAQKKFIESCLADARSDPLTGLANRRALNDELDRRVAQWHRQGTPLSLLLVDVDHFKQFNDAHGHQVGDEMLRSVGNALKTMVREMDLVARYGGEEFAIVLPGITLHHTAITAERLRRCVETSRSHFRGRDFDVTISIGAAEALLNDDPNTLLRRADEALYAAKRAGRNCCYLHDGRKSLHIERHSACA